MSRVKIASHRVRETVQYLYIKRSQRRFFFFPAVLPRLLRVPPIRNNARNQQEQQQRLVYNKQGDALFSFFLFAMHQPTSGSSAPLFHNFHNENVKQFKWIWDADLLVDLFLCGQVLSGKGLVGRSTTKLNQNPRRPISITGR